MTAPRLEIALDKLHHNARTLVERLGARGIAVSGVTKAVLGSPEVAAVLQRAGIRAFGDSRIDNIELMRRAGVTAPITLIRTPVPSQVKRVVRAADTSFNTELPVIRLLSAAAQAARRTHRVVLMVELGDLREGIMPRDLEGVARETLRLPNIALAGIGTNLACRNGVSPDTTNMTELSALADSTDATFGITLEVVSGGNSANLQWALSGAATGRINDLRLGESILFGCEALHRRPLPGLHRDAIALVAEVIESKIKPSRPWGEIAQSAFGAATPSVDKGPIWQAIVAIGRQDVDPDGLQAPPGMRILGASSDHLILDSGDHRPRVGAELTFQLNYSALIRAATSPYVTTVMRRGGGRRRHQQSGPAPSASGRNPACIGRAIRMTDQGGSGLLHS